MPNQIIEKILNANVYDVAVESALERAPQLSQRFSNDIYLKREDTQSIFSFKLRGAYNKIFHLSDQEKAAGVVAASAGNHAQGVALAGHTLGISTSIVMPETTPPIKVEAVKRLGGETILHGDSYDAAYLHAKTLAENKGMVLIHPFDDIDVIAGQGTIGMELIRQMRQPVDAIFLPVGGGGLIAGVSAYIKYLRPEIKIIGVEPEDSPTLHAALKQGEPVVLESVGLFADGVAVKKIGEQTFTLANAYVDEVLLVKTDEICAAIKDVFEDTRTLTEPAGALAVAGIKKYIQREGCEEQRLIAVLSGANVNFDRLRHIAERAEFGEQREALLAVTIPECPGSFRHFCEVLGKRGISEFNYRYSDQSSAHVFAGISLSEGLAERDDIIQALASADYQVQDMTDNEMAKLHLRHMIGGRTTGLGDEVLYRFQFPERPGALLDFLTAIGDRWNISLFHYRNHGAAYGRVLVGLQVPQAQREQCRQSFDALSYRYYEETDNDAYRLFLGPAE